MWCFNYVFVCVKPRGQWKRGLHSLFPSSLYLLQGSSEAVLGPDQVSFLPVLLPQRVPALDQAGLQLHSAGKALFCYSTEVRSHVQTPALLQQKLCFVFKVIYGETQRYSKCELYSVNVRL